jgi:hypothetical protein
VFRNVIAVSVQNTFRLEIHKNNIFFLKNLFFDISKSKRSENIIKLILSKKNIQNLVECGLNRVFKHA